MIDNSHSENPTPYTSAASRGSRQQAYQRLLELVAGAEGVKEQERS